MVFSHGGGIIFSAPFCSAIGPHGSVGKVGCTSKRQFVTWYGNHSIRFFCFMALLVGCGNHGLLLYLYYTTKQPQSHIKKKFSPILASWTALRSRRNFGKSPGSRVSSISSLARSASISSSVLARCVSDCTCRVEAKAYSACPVRHAS